MALHTKILTVPIGMGLAVSTALSLRGLVIYLQVQGITPTAAPVPNLEGLGAAGFLTILLRFVVQPAVFEETALRAYLQPRLAQVWAPVAAVAGSAAVGIAVHWHIDRFYELLWMLAIGSVTLATLMHLTHSYSVVVGTHLLFNLTGVLLDLYASSVATPGEPIVTAYEMLIAPVPLLALSLIRLGRRMT